MDTVLGQDKEARVPKLYQLTRMMLTELLKVCKLTLLLVNDVESNMMGLMGISCGRQKNLRLKLMLIAGCLVYTWFETALHQTNPRKSGHRLCRPGRHGN